MTVDALFIADLHLQVGEPATLDLARTFLQQLAAQSPHLYILGDLVEYWIGDDADDGSLDALFNNLLQLSQSGTAITLMHGNRDFLLGQAFATGVGATLVTSDSLLLENDGQPVLLMHGDTLCTDDHAYQAMRTQIRSQEWQQAFLAKPVEERRAFADNLRRKSQALSAEKDHNIMDVNDQSVRDALELSGVKTLVHGHTHKPAQHDIKLNGVTATRFVLGDWHPDHAVYGVLEDGVFRLERFEA